MVMESQMKWLWLSLMTSIHALECHELKGVWWGILEDTQHLMLDEPMPVWIDIQQHKQTHWGRFKTLKEHALIESMIWSAQCRQGRLYNMTLTNQSCGKNSASLTMTMPLTLKLHWENAMTETVFNVQLKPMQSKQAVPPLPQQDQLHTCH